MPVATADARARARPRPASAADSRPAPAAVAAHSVTAVALARPGRSRRPASRAGSPATGSKRRTVSAAVVGALGHGRQRGARRPRSRCRRRSKGTCRRGKALLLAVLRAPGRGQRLGQRGLLVEQLDGTVADPARLDQHDLRPRPRGDRAGRASSVVEEGQPRLHAVELHALGQVLPDRRAPGPARDQAARRLAAGPWVSTSSRQP